MSPRVDIVPATSSLAERLAPKLRRADADEVCASHGWTPLQALLRSLELTPAPKCLLFDGEPVAMWGVEPVNEAAGMGVAWLLGSDDLTRWPLTFWRVCKDELAALRVEWPVLVNWIDARYEASLRWARHLGFKVDPPKPFGPAGALFCCAALVR